MIGKGQQACWPFLDTLRKRGLCMNKLVKFLKKPDMLRFTLNRSMKKCLIALVFLLLWRQFINRGLQVVQVGFFSMGILFFVLAWFSYLGLDGLEGPRTLFRSRNKEKRSSRKRSGDMMDYVEEDVVTMDELSDEERHACGLASNLIAGLLFFVPALIASFF